MAEGEELRFKSIEPEQHFTEPPPRFNEATLVKELESDGVGRPSTYASILSTIQEREYVKKDGGKFVPTELGMVVTDLLLENFKNLFDVTYTARMEVELDEIEEGKIDWREAMCGVLRTVPERPGTRRTPHDRHQAHGGAHRRNLREVRQAVGDQVGAVRQVYRLHRVSGVHQHARAAAGSRQRRRRLSEQDAQEYCENCGRPMVLKKGRFGQFFACSGYPDCKTTKQIGGQQKKSDVPLEEKCPQCGNNLVLKNGRFGEFTACSKYPKCKYVKQKTIGVPCPNCSEGEVVERRSKKGKTFFGCNRYPDCDFVAWGKPIQEKCPECGSSYLIEKWLKAGPVAQCPNGECKFKKPLVVPVEVTA